jgi:hypothetical protein
MVSLVEVQNLGRGPAHPFQALEPKEVVSSVPATPGLRPQRISTTAGDANVVERLWMTLMYLEVYLRAYSDGLEVEINLARFL